jgi:hypothetical protein
MLNAQQDARHQQIEDRRAEAERELAEQRAQDEALQAYRDQMSTLLLEKDLSDDKVQTLIRARTVTVLSRMDPGRKTQVMQFLDEVNLLQRRVDERVSISREAFDLSKASVNERAAAISLADADLSGADLTNANLIRADLSDVDLTGANVAPEQLLGKVASLKGATLPNGQKYKDWLKSEGSGEDGENSGP